MMVLCQDECHLLWGDVCGYAWGPRSQKITVPLLNQRQRQTFYGAVEFLGGRSHIHMADAGNSQNTQAYLEWLMELYPGKKLLLLWDGATYHRDQSLREFLERINGDLPPEKWRITLCRFAPNAPDQNPMEDVWLAAKNYLRRNFAFHETFAQVKQGFLHFLHSFQLNSAKFDWYNPHLN